MTATVDDRRTTEQPDDRASSRRIVANHYEIDLERPLGSGGMSIVYLGRDLKARRLVALRTLRPEYRRDQASRARFRQETRRMAFIQHPNVARVFDYQENDEAPWAVIEYVPGSSLKEIVDEHGPLDVELIAAYLTQIADALSQLHARGFVHLDVKPHNIIVTTDGTIKLIDFGLAQPANTPQELVGGLAFGTAAYLSPEQASGEPVGPTSDVYSLGCVTYELLTGRPPFTGQGGEERSSDIIQAHLHRLPTPPSRVAPDAGIPGWVDELLMWSLAKRPVDRFDDVRLFVDLFVQGSSGELRTEEARSMREEMTAPIETRLEFDQPQPSKPGYGQGVPAAPPVSKRMVRSVSRSRLPGRIWRLIVALFVANALLAGVLYFQRGTIPGIYSGAHHYLAGADASVVAESLNVRAEPGLAGTAIYALESGATVTLAGNSIAADGEVWWPVTVDDRPELGTGYVWQEGIEPELTTGRDLLEGELEQRIERLRDSISSR